MWERLIARLPRLSSRDISSQGQVPRWQPIADHYWCFSRSSDPGAGHCRPAGQPLPSTQKQKARDGAQRKNVRWHFLKKKTTCSEELEKTFIYCPNCDDSSTHTSCFCCKLLFKLFADYDLFSEIKSPDALLFSKSSKCAVFFFFFPREEINSFSRQASFRRLNSVSTDPRVQVQTHTSTHTLSCWEQEPAGFWETRSTHPPLPGPGVAGVEPLASQQACLLWRPMITGCCSFKQMACSVHRRFLLISHSVLFISFIFVFFHFLYFFQPEDYALLRVDSRMKSSELSLVSSSLRAKMFSICCHVWKDPKWTL